MDYKFTVLTLTMSAVLLYGISISLPYRRDTATQLKNCDKNIPHVAVVNKTDNRKLNCHKCTQCPVGHGLNIPCNGQNVSLAELHIECEKCVAGVNYSTEDSIQCKPCLPDVCKDGVQTLGACEADGDKRTCKHCELKDWYYNKTDRICQPCSCQNMTDEIKIICIGLGFNYNLQCGQDPNTTSQIPSVPHTNKRTIWDMKYTIVVACFVGVLLIAYFCCITKRMKNLTLNHPRPTVCSKEWFCQIFLFKETTRSRPTSSTIEEQNGCVRRVFYFRQNSCPVTQDEKYLVNQDSHAPLGHGDTPEKDKLIVRPPHHSKCKRKSLKFFDMNAEVCRQICRKLRQNVDTGMGYITLAGLMGFSASDVKDFEEKVYPCQEMFSCWSNLNKKENTVLKLKELVKHLKRDDILELIESELKKMQDKCKCCECSASC